MRCVTLIAALLLAQVPARAQSGDEDRMAWWREARFGMFIHWGLYAVPAGKWGDKDTYGEWIMNHAHIPVEEYERLRERFNPVNFDAHAIVRAAKSAGMRYIVITAKHHDGFCLWDSKFTDYDVMSTPFHRDIIREMADACRDEGVRLCLYYSIMDWHHPDYLPRRDWEKRSTEGADFERYIRYMKDQLGELLTNYGPIGVIWFDGQWEGTWTHERAVDLERYIRGLRPDININNRIDKGASEGGLNRKGEFVGDFGTPEQEIPPTGVPGVDWESCMTMNTHWGYNAADKDFKSADELVRKLADIASKGGNFLLNVGPMADGRIPPESVERLAAIGRWMDNNEESIRGTKASPFPDLPPDVRCTQRSLPDGNTRLYLHLFDIPESRRVEIPGLYNQPIAARWLDEPRGPRLTLERGDGSISIATGTPASASGEGVPRHAPPDRVIALDIVGTPDVGLPPEITARAPLFVDSTRVTVSTPQRSVELRYTTDSAVPSATSPLVRGPIDLAATTTISVRAFRGDRPVSRLATATFTKRDPAPAAKAASTGPGLQYEYFEGDWKSVDGFASLAPIAKGVATDLSRSQARQKDHFGFRYRGFIDVPSDGAYIFSLASDDGSRLTLDGELLIDNDGPHSITEKSGVAALARGLHSITLDFFEISGGHELELWWDGPGQPRQMVPAAAFRHEP
jgi:alpha-L-fucosidase